MPLSKRYLVRRDVQGRIGQLCFILGLFPHQTGCFFHFLELLCKLEGSGKVTLVLHWNAELTRIDWWITLSPFATSFSMLFNFSSINNKIQGIAPSCPCP